jgi:hypothetical protein
MWHSLNIVHLSNLVLFVQHRHKIQDIYLEIVSSVTFFPKHKIHDQIDSHNFFYSFSLPIDTLCSYATFYRKINTATKQAEKRWEKFQNMNFLHNFYFRYFFPRLRDDVFSTSDIQFRTRRITAVITIVDHLTKQAWWYLNDSWCLMHEKLPMSYMLYSE